MKGISAMISTVLLIVISIALATIVSGWFTSMSTEQSKNVANTTTERLSCQYADMYIKNSTYNCNGDCSQGISHTLTINVVNSGKRQLYMDKVVVKNTTGIIFSYNLDSTKTLSVGDVSTLTNVSITTCNGINNTIESVIVSSTNCPNTAFDSLSGADVTFTNC